MQRLPPSLPWAWTPASYPTHIHPPTHIVPNKPVLRACCCCGAHAQALAAHRFPIPPEQLVAKAKMVLALGVHNSQDLAEDFQFSGRLGGGLGGGQ